jgi:2-keto-3-deoxy-L-arabinonate dehydratase
VSDQHHWTGIIPSLCTPFQEDDSIDFGGQRAIVRFALASGAHGILCFGLAGEVNKLTPKERMRLAETILEEVNGRVPVLVGVGAEAEHTAICLTRDAQKAGADGIVIPPPITAHVDGEGLNAYFRTIAASTHLPVVIQDAPAYLGVKLSPQLVRQLADEQPNIRYAKLEAGPDATAHWVAHLEQSVYILTGDAGLHLLTTLRAGAVGNVPGVELTDLLVAVYNADRCGDAVTAESLHQRLLPYLVFSLQDIDHYNACSKELLVRRGVLPRGGLRSPAPRLSPLAMHLLEKYVTDLGLSATCSQISQS